jgi:hypothetical protein
MGRPIKTAFMGNTTTGGEQIQGYAWTAGDSAARESYIVKQKATSSYVMASINGTGVPGGGQVYLVNGAVTAAGQGNILVEPYGFSGVGATATANLGISGSPTVVVSGTGDTTADYYPTMVLSLQGGTYTGNQQANVTVQTVKVRTVAAENAGSGYVSGDYFLFTGPGFSTGANVVVNTVNAGGSITSLSVNNAGVYTSSQLRTDPLTANSAVTTSGVNATFNIGWGLNAVSVTNAGDYSVIPANPVSLSVVGSGVGGTINVTYSVSSVKVTAAGIDYDIPPNVVFSTGNATATALLSSTSVASVTVDSGGSGYTAKPTVSLTTNGTAGYARKITDNIVHTFDGKQYKWLLEGNTLPGPGWAHIKSS